MKRTTVLATALVLSLAEVPTRAQAQVETQAAIRARAECRTTALLIFDVKNLKITASPQRIELSFPRPSDTDRDVCFTWVMVGGEKNDKFEQLNLKGFNTVTGRRGKPLFKIKKPHDPNGDKLISLEFNDVPDWDVDNNGNFDGQLDDIKQEYTVDAKFKGNAVEFDPEIIIKKPGG